MCGLCVFVFVWVWCSMVCLCYMFVLRVCMVLNIKFVSVWVFGTILFMLRVFWHIQGMLATMCIVLTL